MANNPSTSSQSDAYKEGVKWTVGLSSAGVAGVFLHLQEISKQGTSIRVLVAIALFLFIACIFAGVHYLHWIMAADLDRERIKDLDEKIQASPRDPSVDGWNKDRKKCTNRIDASNRLKPVWHKAYIISFTLAAVVSTVILVLAVFMYREPPNKDGKGNYLCACNPTNTQTLAHASSNRFQMTYSAAHQGRHRKVIHTFLLDQENGNVWQMICQTGNKSTDQVIFKQVERIDIH